MKKTTKTKMKAKTTPKWVVLDDVATTVLVRNDAPRDVVLAVTDMIREVRATRPTATKWVRLEVS